MSITITPKDKKYESALDNQCSPIAMKATEEVSRKIGLYDFRENDESVYTGHIYDMTATYKDRAGEEHDVRFETELKREWNDTWSKSSTDVPYKWPTMDFPYRKRDKGEVHADYHDIVGDGWLFRCPRQVVLESPVENKWCRNTKCKEPFFRVPLPSPGSEFWHETNGEWELVRKWNSDGELIVNKDIT